MNTFNIRVDGSRTTFTIQPYLVALLWGAGVEDVPAVLQELIEDAGAWEWSAQWSDTVSGRLQAIAMRYVADSEWVEWVAGNAQGVERPVLPREPWGRDLGRVSPVAGR